MNDRDYEEELYECEEQLNHEVKAHRATRDEIHEVLGLWRRGIIGANELAVRVSEITFDDAHTLNRLHAENEKTRARLALKELARQIGDQT